MNLADILTTLIREHGKDILKNRGQVMGIVADRHPNAKREQNLIKVIYNVGLIEELLRDGGSHSQQRMIKKLKDEYLINDTSAEEVVLAVCKAMNLNGQECQPAVVVPTGSERIAPISQPKPELSQPPPVPEPPPSDPSISLGLVALFAGIALFIGAYSLFSDLYDGFAAGHIDHEFFTSSPQIIYEVAETAEGFIVSFDGKLKYKGELFDLDKIRLPHDEKGIIVWPDGKRYEGSLVTGVFHGKGLLTYPDGTKYEGSFRNNKMEGEGIFTFSHGGIFEGSFADGVPKEGVCIKRNGDKVKCLFVNNEFIEEVVK